MGSLLFYVLVMLALYLSPLLIRSPCVLLADQLPRKPLIIAHRGAAAVRIAY